MGLAVFCAMLQAATQITTAMAMESADAAIGRLRIGDLRYCRGQKNAAINPPITRHSNEFNEPIRGEFKQQTEIFSNADSSKPSCCRRKKGVSVHILGIRMS